MIKGVSDTTRLVRSYEYVIFMRQITLRINNIFYGLITKTHSRQDIVMLTAKQLRELRTSLDTRFTELREDIRLELLKSEEQHYIDLAGQVHDLEDQSVAGLLVDIELTMIDRHIDEIRDIEAAMIRLSTGIYGVCADCETDIAVERLRAYPTAKRCRPCQVRYEHYHAGSATPSL